jgi:Arc/MetJ-type ribon-helix-helix transcriptional regulator
MKTLTVRLPDSLAAKIEAEAKRRTVSKSDVVRERLEAAGQPTQAHTVAFDAIADLVGSVDALPADLSRRKRHYLATSGYGRKRPR